MEAISATAQDDSSGANPSSVKSEDSSPQNEGGRGSPPPNCAICLGTCRNKSFTDSCLHQFCFKCLLTWSKVKAECPLCKQNFKSIIHNVRSNHQYEEYMVEQQQTEETVESIDDHIVTAARRFRYRTTVTLPRQETLALQQLLMQYPMVADVFPGAGAGAGAGPGAGARRRRDPAAFRRTVYRHNLWARPLPDFTGRFRDCTPEFYRYNSTQIHRLVPWINRELCYLLNDNTGHISYVLSKIVELLPVCHINSIEFREAMQRYFGHRSEHFLHELFCFASTPYDMTGYDRNVQYTTDTRISNMVNEVISSAESDTSVDSDIVMVSHSQPAEPPPGPSWLPAPVYPQNYIPQSPSNVIPIETISHSDTDDDSSEVMVVGYIKPPQDRTPEVVDLLGSDSDVIVQDSTPPEPAQGPSRAPAPTPAPGASTAAGASTASAAAGSQPRIGIVRLSLKRHRSPPNSDSEDSTYSPPPRPTRRRRANAAATDTDDTSPTPTPPETPDRNDGSATAASSSCSSSSSAPNSPAPRRRLPKKKSKRKTTKESRGKKKSKKLSRSRSRPRARRASVADDGERDKRSKRKSRSGIGVKSSKKSAAEASSSPAAAGADAAGGPSGPSGPSGAAVAAAVARAAAARAAATVAVAAYASASASADRDRRRSSRESRRLKSVVNVMYKKNNTEEASVVNMCNDSGASSSNTNKSVVVRTIDGGDSDSDDLPLNLSVQKSSSSSTG